MSDAEENANTERDNSSTTIEFAWSVHPARDEPDRRRTGIIVITLTAIAVYVFCVAEGVHPIASAGVSAVASGLLVIALHKFFFPSRFEIDHDEIRARHMLYEQRFPWNRARRFVYDQRGGHLSSRAKSSRLDAFHGLHILFAPESRDDAIARIRKHVEQNRASDDTQ